MLVGDIRRAVAATERLVLLGDAAGTSVHPCERRDLAVLLLHAEMPERAMIELRAFADTSTARQASSEVRPPVMPAGWCILWLLPPLAVRCGPHETGVP